MPSLEMRRGSGNYAKNRRLCSFSKRRTKRSRSSKMLRLKKPKRNKKPRIRQPNSKRN